MIYKTDFSEFRIDKEKYDLDGQLRESGFFII